MNSNNYLETFNLTTNYEVSTNLHSNNTQNTPENFTSKTKEYENSSLKLQARLPFTEFMNNGSNHLNLNSNSARSHLDSSSLVIDSTLKNHTVSPSSSDALEDTYNYSSLLLTKNSFKRVSFSSPDAAGHTASLTPQHPFTPSFEPTKEAEATSLPPNQLLFKRKVPVESSLRASGLVKEGT